MPYVVQVPTCVFLWISDEATEVHRGGTWLPRQGSDLQIPGSKPGDFTCLSTRQYGGGRCIRSKYAYAHASLSGRADHLDRSPSLAERAGLGPAHFLVQSEVPYQLGHLSTFGSPGGVRTRNLVLNRDLLPPIELPGNMAATRSLAIPTFSLTRSCSAFELRGHYLVAIVRLCS